MLRKGVYPYEYINSWKRFNETSLPNKEDFYSYLNMADITDIDYKHAKKVIRELERNNLGNYNNLYVQSDTLSLADIFKNHRNKYIEKYELVLISFITWQA